MYCCRLRPVDFTARCSLSLGGSVLCATLVSISGSSYVHSRSPHSIVILLHCIECADIIGAMLCQFDITSSIILQSTEKKAWNDAYGNRILRALQQQLPTLHPLARRPSEELSINITHVCVRQYMTTGSCENNCLSLPLVYLWSTNRGLVYFYAQVGRAVDAGHCMCHTSS